jgi:hypothetical protein
MRKHSNILSRRAPQTAFEMLKIVFGRGALSPCSPYQGVTLDPLRGLGGPLDPRPDLLFSKLHLLLSAKMKTLI